MAISANTLFHFTKIEGLQGILRSMGFYCQYSDEHFENILPHGSNYRFCYVPMTSFCDLTIMQLCNDSVHRKSFGEFGVGLTKEWGNRNGVSPVMYVHRNSQQTKRLNNLIKELNLLRKKTTDDSALFNLENELIDSFKNIKPYKGYWHRGRKIKRELTYYNEREWRYCPSWKKSSVLSAAFKENKTEKEKLNTILKKKLLSFKPEDVKFILIKDNQSIGKIAATIKKMPINQSQKNELITKIITFEELREDF